LKTNKLLNHRVSLLKVLLKRSVNIQSNVNSGTEMKQLKDSQQFDKTLELFDNYKENNILTCSSLAITQA
ncbi:unnamed protein product, partial [Rotaria magnacalcarata]